MKACSSVPQSSLLLCVHHATRFSCRGVGSLIFAHCAIPFSSRCRRTHLQSNVQAHPPAGQARITAPHYLESVLPLPTNISWLLLSPPKISRLSLFKTLETGRCAARHSSVATTRLCYCCSRLFCYRRCLHHTCREAACSRMQTTPSISSATTRSYVPTRSLFDLSLMALFP